MPEKDDFIPWREFPAQIAAAVYPEEFDRDAGSRKAARGRVRKRILAAIRQGTIEGNATGERVNALSFWKWIYKKYPTFPLPIPKGWVATPFTLSIPIAWRAPSADVLRQAATEATKHLPAEQAELLRGAVNACLEDRQLLKTELERTRQRWHTAERELEERKAKHREAGRKGGGAPREQ